MNQSHEQHGAPHYLIQNPQNQPNKLQLAALNQQPRDVKRASTKNSAGSPVKFQSEYQSAGHANAFNRSGFTEPHNSGMMMGAGTNLLTQMGGLQVQNQVSQSGPDSQLEPMYKKQTSTTLQHSIRNPGNIGIPHSMRENPEGIMTSQHMVNNGTI